MNQKIMKPSFTQTPSGLVIPNNQPQLPPGAKALPVPMGEVMLHGPATQLHVDKYHAKISHHPGDCGVDLYPSHIIGSVPLSDTWAMIKVGTNIHFTFPIGSWGYLTSRGSSLERLCGAMVQGSTIDAGYTGELIVRVQVLNIDSNLVVTRIQECIDKKIALAQVIFLPFVYPIFVSYDEKAMAGGRGNHGFGSTDGMTLAPGIK